MTGESDTRCLEYDRYKHHPIIHEDELHGSIAWTQMGTTGLRKLRFDYAINTYALTTVPFSSSSGATNLHPNVPLSIGS